MRACRGGPTQSCCPHRLWLLAQIQPSASLTRVLMPSAGGVVENAVAILLVQVGFAAVALFVLADGPRRLRDNVGQVALGVAFLAAMAWTTWAQRWAWDNWGHGA